VPIDNIVHGLVETGEPSEEELALMEGEDWTPVDLGATKEEAQRIAQEIIEQAEEEAKRSSQLIIKNAEMDAERLITDSRAKAQDEAENIKEEAYNEGYEHAIAEADKEAQKIIQEAEDIKTQAHEYRKELIASIEPEMIGLVTDILDKLIEVEKDVNPKAISVLIKQGLAKCSLTENIKVHVSKEDLPNVDEEAILSSLDTMALIQFIEDPTLQKGSCIIETDLGNIDCGLDTQYKELRRNLHYILKNR
jgi:flagellar assembly protein FliH